MGNEIEKVVIKIKEKKLIMKGKHSTNVECEGHLPPIRLTQVCKDVTNQRPFLLESLLRNAS